MEKWLCPVLSDDNDKKTTKIAGMNHPYLEPFFVLGDAADFVVTTTGNNNDKVQQQPNIYLKQHK